MWLAATLRIGLVVFTFQVGTDVVATSLQDFDIKRGLCISFFLVQTPHRDRQSMRNIHKQACRSNEMLKSINRY